MLQAATLNTRPKHLNSGLRFRFQIRPRSISQALKTFQDNLGSLKDPFRKAERYFTKQLNSLY
jgi:hypothetical protein